MSAALWSEVVELRRAADLAIETVARRLDAAREEGDVSRVTALLLQDSSARVRELLERCAARGLDAHFAAFGSSAAADAALRLLSFWLNERVRRRLPEAERADWIPVGPEDVELRNGGRLFFDEVDHVLAELERGQERSSAKMESLAALALFCLEQGFEGKYAERPDLLERYKTRLRPCLESRSVAPLEPSAQLLVTRWPMLASAFGVCFVFYLFCVAVSAWLGVG